MVTEEIWTEKYRPKTLEEYVGQEEIIERVKSFIERKTMPHLLFAGPAGTGKTTLALIIAREVLGNRWRDNFMELNASVSKSTPILVKINGIVSRVTFEALDRMYFGNNAVYKYGDGEYVRANNLEVLTVDKKTRKIKWAKVGWLIRHKVNKILRVRLEGNGYLELTGNHSVIVIDEDGNLVEKSAKDLKPGEFLLSFVANIENEHMVEETTIKVPVNNSSGAIMLQSLKLDESLCWLLGTFLTRGAISFESIQNSETTGLIISIAAYSDEGEYVERIKKACDALGMSCCVNSDGTKKLTIQIRISKTQLAEFLSKNFYSLGEKVFFRNKRVANFVYNLPINLRVAFIKGVVEGSKCGSEMRIDDSRDLLVDVAWLSRISGVEPEISLAFSSKVENEKGNLLPAKPYIKFFLEIDRYVKADWKSLLEHQLQENDGRVNKRILIEILNSVDYEKLPSDKKKKFENLLLLATSELHVVKIEAIEELQYNDYVYDVSVPNNEMFFAGDIPILLHNSDERGIQTIREKVKDFARTASTGGAPFKIIFLDEADALTRDAQQALRRIMEKYSSNVRFILNCNYSSKIIDPIQSRCAIFRFKPLSKENIITLLKRICEKEKLNVSDKVLDVIANISEGDARRAINLLQAAVATSERITEDTIYEIASEAKPEEIKEVLMMAYEGRFREARDRLIELMLKYGLSGVDVIKSLMKGVWSLPVKDEDKVDIIDKLGEIEFRLVEGSNPHVQLSAFLAYICKFRKKV